MLTAGWVCIREVHFADPEESVATLAGRMRERGVGALPVLDADRVPTGIVTDRDLVVRALAPGRDPQATRCAEVMTEHPVVTGEETSLEEVLVLMRDRAIRRLPVVDGDGRLVGLVTLDDTLALLADQLSLAGQVCAKQVPGSAPAAERPSRRLTT